MSSVRVFVAFLSVALLAGLPGMSGAYQYYQDREEVQAPPPPPPPPPAQPQPPQQPQQPAAPGPSPEAVQQQQIYEYNRIQQEKIREQERKRRQLEEHERAKRMREDARDRAKSKTGYPEVQPVDQPPQGPASPKVTGQDIDSLGAAIKAHKEKQGDAATPRKGGKDAKGGDKGGPKVAAKDARKDPGLNTDEEIDQAADKLQKEAEKKLKELRERLERERRKLEDEQKRIREEEERRKKDRGYRDRKEREERMKEREREMRERREKLRKEADDLKNKREQNEKDSKNLRQNYQDARRDDPRCEGSYCRALKGELEKNVREARDLQKAETQFQRNAESFDRDARNLSNDSRELEDLKDRGYGMNKAEHRAHLAEKALNERLETLDPTIQNVRDQRDQVKDQRGKAQDRLDQLKADGKEKSGEAREIERQIKRMDGALDKLDKAESSLLSDRAKAQDKVREAQADALGLGDDYRKARDEYKQHARDIYRQQGVSEASEELRSKLPKNAQGEPVRDLTEQEKRTIGRQAEQKADQLAERATAQNFDFGPGAPQRDKQYSERLGEVNSRIDRAQGIKDASDKTLRETSTNNSKALGQLKDIEKAAGKGGPIPKFPENAEARKVAGRLDEVNTQRDALAKDTLERVNKARDRENAAREELKKLGASDNPNASYSGPAANRERVAELRKEVADAQKQAGDIARDYRAKADALDSEAGSLKEKAFTYGGTKSVEPLAKELEAVRRDYGLDPNNRVDRGALAKRAEGLSDPLKKFAAAEADLRDARKAQAELDNPQPGAKPLPKEQAQARRDQIRDVTRSNTPLRDIAREELKKQGLDTMQVDDGPDKGNVYLDGSRIRPVDQAAVDLAVRGLTRPSPAPGTQPAMADTPGNRQAAAPRQQPHPAPAPAPGQGGQPGRVDSPSRPTTPELAKPTTGQQPGPAAPPVEQLRRLDALDAEHKRLKAEFDTLAKQYDKAPEGSPQRAELVKKIEPYYDRFARIDQERGQIRAQVLRQASQPAPAPAAPTSQQPGPAAPPVEQLQRLDALDTEHKRLKAEFDTLAKQYDKAPEGSPQRAELVKKIEPYYDRFARIDQERGQIRAQVLRQASQPTPAPASPTGQQPGPAAPPVEPQKPDTRLEDLGKLAGEEKKLKAEFDTLAKQYEQAPRGSTRQGELLRKIEPYYGKFAELDKRRTQLQDSLFKESLPADPTQAAARIDVFEAALRSAKDRLVLRLAGQDGSSAQAAEIAARIGAIDKELDHAAGLRKQLAQLQAPVPAPVSSGTQAAAPKPPSPSGQDPRALQAALEGKRVEIDSISRAIDAIEAHSGFMDPAQPQAKALLAQRDALLANKQVLQGQARDLANQLTHAQAPSPAAPTPSGQTGRAQAPPPQDPKALQASLEGTLKQIDQLSNAIAALETRAGSMEPANSQTQALLAQRDALLASKQALQGQARVLADQLVLARPVTVSASSVPTPGAAPVPPVPARQQFLDSLGLTLRGRFGDSPLLSGLVLPQLGSFADAAGPESVSRGVGKLLADPSVRAPLTLLARLPDELLSGQAAQGLSTRALAVSRVQYLSTLYQRAQALGGTQAADAAKVLRPLLDEEIEAATDMLQDQALEAEASGDLNLEASILADLVTVQSLGNSYDQSLDTAINRSATVLNALKARTSSSPPDTATQGELLRSTSTLADALDRILAEFAGDLDAQKIQGLQDKASQARFLASGMATRLSSSAPRELNKPSPQAKALEDIALDEYIKGLAPLLDAGRYAQALALANQAPGFREVEAATAYVTGEVLKRYPLLTPDQKRGLPSHEELLAKRFEALGSLARRQDTPAGSATLAAGLALEMAGYGKAGEARAVLDNALKNLGAPTQDNALARATLTGARLSLESSAGTDRKALADMVAVVPEDIRTASAALAFDRLAAQGSVAGIDALSSALPDLAANPGLDMVRTRALLETLLRQPDQAAARTRLSDLAQRAQRLADDPRLAEADRLPFKQLAQSVTGYLNKAEAIRTGIQGATPPPQGYDGLAREALALGRWDLASQALVKGLASARPRQEAEALANLAQLAEMAALRANQPDVDQTARSYARSITTPLLSEGIAFADRRLAQLATELGALEKSLQFSRTSGAKKEHIEALETARAKVTADLRQLGLLRARLESTRDGKSLAMLRQEADTRVADKLKAIKTEFSGVTDSKQDAFKREFLAQALGELDALRAIRDGIADLMIAQSGEARVESTSRKAGFHPPMTMLQSDLDNLDLDLNGDRGARNSLLAASDTRRYFEAFGGGKDVDRIRDAIIAGHEVQYLETRRQQMVLSYPGLSVQARRDLYGDILSREAARWKAQAESVSPLLQVFGIGSFDKARAEAQMDLVRSLPRQFLVSDLARDFADNRTKDPQKAFESLARLQQMNLDAQRDIYLALLKEDDESSWYDRRLIRSNFIAFTHGGVLEEFDRIAGEMSRLHQALIQAAHRPVDRLSPEDREVLASKGFIVNGRYAVPESVTVDPVKLGEQATKENSFIWSVDKVFTPKEVAILGATVVLPGGSAARVARAGGGFLRSASAYRTLGTVLGEAFAQGISRAALAKAIESGAAGTLGSFLARWAGERAVEATVFTAYSRLARAAIDPSQLLTAEFYDPLGLVKEVLHNTAVIGTLGLTGSALGRVESAAAKSLEESLARSMLKQDIFRILALGTSVTVEAGVLTGLNQLLSGATLPQGTFAQNAAVVALLKGFHAVQGGEGAGRVSQTAETMARYNRWLDTVTLPSRTLMNRFKGDWNAARAAYQRGQQIAQLEAEKAKILESLEQARASTDPKEKARIGKLEEQLPGLDAKLAELDAKGETLSRTQMANLVAYRKFVVDSVAASVLRDLGGEVQAFGSTNLTSDYDISFKGPMAELAQFVFAARMRHGFGMASEVAGFESARTLDTNAYTDPIFDRFKGGTDDVRFQDMFANLAARKYLPDKSWSQYRDWLLANAPEASRDTVRQMLDAVEARHGDYESRAARKAAELEAEAGKSQVPPEMRIDDGLTPQRRAEDIQTKARNLLYEQSLKKIVDLMEQYGKATSDADKARLTQEIRNAQSEALYFAAEAYLTQAAISHVVISIQAAGRAITIESLTGMKPLDLSIPLTPDQGRQSYVEQIGNMYKELDHGGTPAKMASKGAKYMLRALDASVIAGVDLKPYRSFMELVLSVEANRSDLGKVGELLKKHYGEGNEGLFVRDLNALERVLTARLFGGGTGQAGWAGEAAKDFARYESLLSGNAGGEPGTEGQSPLDAPRPETAPAPTGAAQPAAAGATPSGSRPGETIPVPDARPAPETSGTAPESSQEPAVPRWQARKADWDAARLMLIDMGLTPDGALFASAIQIVQNNKSVPEAVLIAAYQNALPPSRTLSRLGLTEAQARDVLDAFLQGNLKVQSPETRARWIDNYLSGRKTMERIEAGPGTTAQVTPDGRIVIRVEGEAPLRADEATGMLTPPGSGAEATRDMPPAASEATVGFESAGSPPASSPGPVRPAHLRVVTELLARRGMPQDQAEAFARDQLENQRRPLAQVLDLAQRVPLDGPVRPGSGAADPGSVTVDAPARPTDGPAGQDPLAGFDFIKQKMRLQEEANREQDRRLDEFKEQALEHLGGTNDYGPLVEAARQAGSLSDLARLSMVGTLRQGMSAAERHQADGAFMIVQRARGLLPDGPGLDLLDAARYANFHAGRVAPDTVTSGSRVAAPSASVSAASLAAEALLSQVPGQALTPEMLARAAKISMKEAEQAMDLAERNLLLR